MKNNKNVFLDANILIDFIDSKRKKHSIVTELIKYLILNDFNIFISEDILTTVFYVIKDKKLAIEFIETISEKWNIVCFGKETIKKAIELSKINNLDLEDVLQCLCALFNNCNILITSDKNFFNCGLTIFSPEEFLEELKSLESGVGSV